MVVHSEQKVVMHQTLPPTGSFTITERLAGAYDKGEGAGAVVYYESQWLDAANAPVATMTMGLFARADGGFGGPGQAPRPHPTPTREPDTRVSFPSPP